MTANIAFETMFVGRSAAWHGLGTILPGGFSPLEAVRSIGADYTVEKYPLYAHIQTPFGVAPTLYPNRYALVRSPIPGKDDNCAVFGDAGANYEVLQNTDFAQALESLAEVWPCETVGILGRGETLFVTLKLGDFDVRGEAIDEYFLVTNTSDGKSAVRFAFTPIRVVCQNTLSLGLAQATVTASMRHSTGARQELNFRTALLEELSASRDLSREALRELADFALNAEYVEDVLKAVFPLPKKSVRAANVGNIPESPDFAVLREMAEASDRQFDNLTVHILCKREHVRQLFGKFNDEFPATARSAWALYNAICESADWRESNRSLEEVYESAVFGARSQEKVKAFKTLYRMASGK